MIFTGRFEKTRICPYPGAAFYGQIPKIAILPVTAGWVLRADSKKRRFARNQDLHFTGKSQESPFCP